jgi:hypothetical protein
MLIMDKSKNEVDTLSHVAIPLFESLTKLLWPVITIFSLFYILPPISNFVDMTLNNNPSGGKLNVKVAGIEVELSNAVHQETKVSTQLVKEVKYLNERLKVLEKVNLTRNMLPVQSYNLATNSNQDNLLSVDKFDQMKSHFLSFQPNLVNLKTTSPLIIGEIKSLLWVEDTPANSAVIIQTLRETGIKVKIVQTSDDALEHLSNDV